MGAIDKADSHQRILRAEEVGVDEIQLIPAQIVIAVAGGTGKVTLRHPVLPEGGQHPVGVVLRDGVDAGKLLGKGGFRLLRKQADSLGNP